MKNLTKVSLITVCSFLLILFCGYSLAETGSSPASSASAAVKASEETPFPAQSVPGLYVSKSPAFSVSYPANWVEKAPDLPSCVFRATSTEGFPELRILRSQSHGRPFGIRCRYLLARICEDLRGCETVVRQADSTSRRQHRTRSGIRRDCYRFRIKAEGSLCYYKKRQ